MVSSDGCAPTALCLFFSWELLRLLPCSCVTPVSFLPLRPCLIASMLLLNECSRLLRLKGLLKVAACSGEVEPLTGEEQEEVLVMALVPGGRDREERIQLSMGSNWGSTMTGGKVGLEQKLRTMENIHKHVRIIIFKKYHSEMCFLFHSNTADKYQLTIPFSLRWPRFLWCVSTALISSGGRKDCKQSSRNVGVSPSTAVNWQTESSYRSLLQAFI